MSGWMSCWAFTKPIKNYFLRQNAYLHSLLPETHITFLSLVWRKGSRRFESMSVHTYTLTLSKAASCEQCVFLCRNRSTGKEKVWAAKDETTLTFTMTENLNSCWLDLHFSGPVTCMFHTATAEHIVQTVPALKPFWGSRKHLKKKKKNVLQGLFCCALLF